MAPSESTLTLNTSHGLTPNETAGRGDGHRSVGHSRAERDAASLLSQTRAARPAPRRGRTTAWPLSTLRPARLPRGASVNASSGAAKAARRARRAKSARPPPDTGDNQRRPQRRSRPRRRPSRSSRPSPRCRAGAAWRGLPVSFWAECGHARSATCAVTDAAGEARGVRLRWFQTSKVSARAGSQVTTPSPCSVRPAVSLTVAAAPSPQRPRRRPSPHGDARGVTDVMRNVLIDLGEGNSEQLRTMRGATSRAGR